MKKLPTIDGFQAFAQYGLALQFSADFGHLLIRYARPEQLAETLNVLHALHGGKKTRELARKAVGEETPCPKTETPPAAFALSWT